MKRREFLIGAAAAALASSRSSWGQVRDQAKLSRVAIMSLSFNSILKNPSQPDTPPPSINRQSSDWRRRISSVLPRVAEE